MKIKGPFSPRTEAGKSTDDMLDGGTSLTLERSQVFNFGHATVLNGTIRTFLG